MTLNRHIVLLSHKLTRNEINLSTVKSTCFMAQPTDKMTDITRKFISISAEYGDRGISEAGFSKNLTTILGILYDVRQSSDEFTIMLILEKSYEQS